MILGLDLSHFQSGANFGAIRAAGRDFVVLKATEGVGYVDPSFVTYRKAAHAAGLIIGIYHFGRDNSPTAEAAYFAGVVGTLQPGEFLVLDQEVTHASGNVAWCSAWLDATRSHYGIAPLIYMNKGSSTGLTSGNWSSIASTYGLWLASYDNSTAQPSVPYWGAPAMKQYSDVGSVLGVAGTCDVDVFYGTTTQLLAYGKGGKPAPAPAPTEDPNVKNLVLGHDTTPAQTGVWVGDGVVRRHVADNAELAGLQYWIGQKGGDPAVHDIADLRVLGQDVGAAALQIGDVHGKVVDSKFDLAGRPGNDQDDLLGQVLSIRAELREKATPTVDPKGLADALVADAQAVGTLADALAAAIAKRLGNG